MLLNQKENDRFCLIGAQMCARAAGCLAAALAVLLGVPAGICLAAELLATSAAEVSEALRKARPGDAIVLKNGIWKDQYIRFEGEGTEREPLILRAQTGGKVVLTGTSRLDISGRWLVVDGLRFDGGALEGGQHIVRFTGKKGDATHSRLTNSAIINYNPRDLATRYFWISLFGHDNRLDHNRFEGQSHSGVTVVVWRKQGVVDRHTIDFNHFLNRPAGEGNGFETIRIGTSDSASSDSETVVQSNLFERTNGELEIISIKSGNNDIRFNTFRQAVGTVTIRHGSGNRVTGNFFLGDHVSGTGGIRIMGSGHVVANNYFQDLAGQVGGGIVFYCGHAVDRPGGNSPIKQAVVAHNSFVNTPRAAFRSDAGCGTKERTELPENIKLVNNLVSSHNGLFLDGAVSKSWIISNNLYFGKSGDTLFSLGVIHKDPKLRLGSGDLYRPDADSPALNAAVATEGLTSDMDGQVRDSMPDIGADERSDEPIVIRPLNESDVGPNWFHPRVARTR